MFRNFFDFKNIIIGLLSGMICGLFASGGGMILVPTFIYLLNMKDVEARATSLICILPMVVTSGFFYYKKELINWNIGILCATGGIIGGIIGAKLLKRVPTKYLRIAFTCFLIYSAFRLIIKI